MKKYCIWCIVMVLIVAMMFSGCHDDGMSLDSQETEITSSADTDVEAESPPEYFEYVAGLDNQLLITKYTGTEPHVVVPKMIDRMQVVQIGPECFEYNNHLVSVVIPDCVNAIGEAAFRCCEKLTDVRLPKNLTKINRRMFLKCTALRHITFSENITLIEPEAFSGSGLQSVDLNEGLTEIGANAFAGSKLTEIVLPSTVKTIGGEAFTNCKNLSSVTLNNGLEEIEMMAFSYCENLEELIIPATVTRVSLAVLIGCTHFTTMRFEGNAPETFATVKKEEWGYCPDFTVYYHDGAKGFSSPEWKGYKTAVW